MRKLTIAGLILIAVVLSLATACRRSHLGDEHGQYYRAAFKKQATQAPKEEIAPLDAKDAALIMEKHREDPSDQSRKKPAVQLGGL